MTWIKPPVSLVEFVTGLRLRQCGIDQPGEDRSQDRLQPEQPQLLQSPSANDDRGSRAARRIYREIRDTRALIGCAEYDHKEQECKLTLVTAQALRVN